MGIQSVIRGALAFCGIHDAGRVVRRASFDNRNFWNERYITDPEKGSGPGSRGESLDLKVGLIRSAIERHGIETVLDIGCGDIAFAPFVTVKNYVGIDISDVVIAENRRKKPEWRFVCADLGSDYTPPEAGLVLCLDVLIHQKSHRAYLKVLAKALESAKKIALVSGYTCPDPGWNVFFHEPLRESVARLSPRASIARVAQYRGTDLLAITK